MSNKHDEGREEWHASPKPKKPLSERLDSLSNKILREQLAKERQLRKELYQATYDWTNHMELWLEEAKFRIDSADLEDLKALIQQGEKAIQKAKGT